MGVSSSFGKFPTMPVPIFPVGVPFPWISTSSYPDGTLLCDGSNFSTTTYPELAVVFPTGVLPDLRGVGLRGLDHGRGLDVDGVNRAIGSYQADEFKSHNHKTYATDTVGNPVNGTGDTVAWRGGGTPSGLTTGYTGGTETRGKNVAVDWLVYAETLSYDLTLNQGSALTLGGYTASYFTPLANIPSLIKSNLNVTGDAPMGVCRAWINFNGTTTTPTIRGSMNVSSITDNGVGDYTINFTTPMPDANYTFALAVNNFGKSQACDSTINVYGYNGEYSLSTTSIRVTSFIERIGPAAYDASYVSVAIFR